MRISAGQHLRVYFAMLFGSASLVAILCLAVNILVDPLWYVRGNVITHVNYAFNERTAKMVRFLPRMTDYDCVLIGSSHTALLHEHQITDHRCFNLGFSHGRVGEFLPYAKYLRERGFRPSLIVINVDLYDFLDPPDALTVPSFIRSISDPPSILRTYLSLDALNFSSRTLLGSFPNHLVYDADKQMHIIPKAHAYRPPRHLIPRLKPPAFHSELAGSFIELRRAFPEARAIGWLPPISAWTIAQLKLDGSLTCYLDASQSISQGYDEFLDFSIPSEITAGTANTFDGLHYVDDVNDRVLAALMSNNADFGVDWRRVGPTDIANQYNARLDEFVFHARRISEVGSEGARNGSSGITADGSDRRSNR
jgi:hypothetical protein